MSERYLIVGLGNPGGDYEFTRHNIGFLVLRKLAEKLKVNFQLSSFTNGLTVEGKYQEKDFIFLLPLTYMNNSGVAVKDVVINKEIDYTRILVVCDDLNLDFSQMRIRRNGSSGGNNGIKSVIEKLNTKDFSRLRIGIGSPCSKDFLIDFVLEEFTNQEKKCLEGIINQATDCCLLWMTEGVNYAMQQFNRRNEDG